MHHKVVQNHIGEFWAEVRRPKRSSFGQLCHWLVNIALGKLLSRSGPVNLRSHKFKIAWCDQTFEAQSASSAKLLGFSFIGPGMQPPWKAVSLTRKNGFWKTVSTWSLTPDDLGQIFLLHLSRKRRSLLLRSSLKTLEAFSNLGGLARVQSPYPTSSSALSCRKSN